MPIWEKLFNRITWRNLPQKLTPIDERNLNRIEAAVDGIDNRVLELNATMLPVEVANTMVKSFGMDTKTGVITVTLLNGTVYTWDLNIEKIPVSLSMTADAVLILETADGEVYEADLKGLIDTYIFDDSDTLAFSAIQKADGKHVTAEVKEGSIEGRHLNPDYLAGMEQSVKDAQGQAELSADYAIQAKRYAVGGIVPEDAADNAKYYAEQAAKSASSAEETVKLNLPSFEINAGTMHLLGSIGENMDFKLDENGHLIGGVTI